MLMPPCSGHDAGAKPTVVRTFRPFFHRAVCWPVAAGLLFAGSISLAGCGSSTPPTERAQHAAESAHADDQHQAPTNLVHLDSDQLEALGIETATAGPGTLRITKSFPGEVGINQERYAHVVARVAGVAISVRASVGEQVKAGETLAILESRDLAQTTAAYLGAREQTRLAQDQFERMDRLYQQGIATESEHLRARQALSEARIKTQASRHALLALGFSASWIEELPNKPDASRFRYPLKAPISGSVIQRHLTRGEAVDADSEAFEIADLSEVWVDLDIFQQDMAQVREGQIATISAGATASTGTIIYVRPIVGEQTRAALARVVLDNPVGDWKPGMFVSGSITLDKLHADTLIAQSAIQIVDDHPVVFVRTDEGFRLQRVTLGTKGEHQVAVREGLTAGDVYASSGTFTLKAELAKGSFEAGHEH